MYLLEFMEIVVSSPGELGFLKNRCLPKLNFPSATFAFQTEILDFILFV